MTGEEEEDRVAVPLPALHAVDVVLGQPLAAAPRCLAAQVVGQVGNVVGRHRPAGPWDTGEGVGQGHGIDRTRDLPDVSGRR